MECIVSIGAKISEYTIQGIFHHVGYVVFCHRNVKGLKEQVDNLVFDKHRVRHLIYEAKNNAEDIEDVVQAWLTNVDEITEKAYKFLIKGEETQKSCWNKSYLNLAERHSLSRKAKKMAKEVGKIHRRGKFNKVSYRGPLPGIENSGYQHFESRMSTMGQIMEALRHSDINKIGVYGMGGIGKTMLVKEIARDVQKEKLFEEVIMATIGQNQNVESIQGQLGDMLKLQFGQETRQGRAALLRKRLRTEKKILIILDDIWNVLDFETVGIPCRDDYEGCKLLVTSRSEHMLSNKMGIENNFEVKALSVDEAWKFFKNMIGEESIETDRELKKMAIKVAEECGELPIALVTVAKALKGKSLPIWRDALRQLQSPATVDIEGVSNEVYASIKLSYDHLSCADAKKIFLLCSIFPDDHDIDMENLIRYATGLKFIEGINTLGTATDRILKLVDDLKSCCLLQSSKGFTVRSRCRYFGNRYVIMHDVIRDVAIYIASRDAQMCTFSYVEEFNEWRDEDTHGPYKMVLANCVNFQNLPRKLNFPKLELLALVDMRYRVHHIQIQEEFFEEMEKLRVLHLEKMHLPQTPSLFHALVNVRTLILINCRLGNVDMIGKLKNLEVLDLFQSDIMSLPLSISQLIRLKQLNVSNCAQLKVIPGGVISKLTKLEGLLMDNSFNGWEVDFNASISELDHLPFLTCLCLCIPDEKHLPKNAFSNNVELEHFRIIIGKRWQRYSDFRARRVLDVKMDSRNFIFEGAGINKLLQKSEELKLEGAVDVEDVLVELNRSGDPPNLRHLRISSNEAVECLMSEFDMALSCKALAKLESLKLENMMRLNSIVQGSMRTIKAFENIKFIEVNKCHKLRHLFSVSIMEGLSKLDVISVSDCEMMEAIVVMEDEEATDKIECRQLRNLLLIGLPRLMNFCVKLNRGLIQTSEEVQQIVANSLTPFDGKLVFPNLKFLNIQQVPNDTWCEQLIANDSNIMVYR